MVLAYPTTGNWHITPKFLELIDVNKIDVERLKRAIRENKEILNRKILNLEEEYNMFLEFYSKILLEVKYPDYNIEICKKIAYNRTYENDKYKPYNGIKEELKELSLKYKLLLLSDNWPDVINSLKEYEIYNLFEKIYVSSIYGQLKKDGDFFDNPINDFKIIDGEAVFIDDSEKLLEIAKSKGLKVKLMDREKKIQKSKFDIINNLKNIDLISFAPHKFYGLNGFGALIKNKEIVLEPLINGGASTTIYRSGTPVIGQICALEKALEISFNNLEERKKYVKNINKKLRANLSKYKDVKINTISDENPFILNISVNGVKATEFKNKLEEYGVCISIKSACTITITPSRIVMAMTHDRKRALDSFRISLSHLVKESEINKFLEIFDKCYKYFKEV